MYLFDRILTMQKRLKKIAIKILSIPVIKIPLQSINAITLWFGSLNRITSMIYGLIFFIPFGREQHAVVAGKYQFYKNTQHPKISNSRLRRNIHRLEKGLIMQPPRDHFASGYIRETVDIYKKMAEASKDGATDLEELAWASQVLARYFTTVKNTPETIQQARVSFESFDFEINKTTNRTPYAAKDRSSQTIPYEDFLNLANHRRSVRWFKKEKVPREIIDKALLAARQAPSACNRLPYEFRLFDDTKLVKKVANLPFGASGYANNIPTIAVVVGKMDSYFSSRDRHAFYIDSSLAAMSFIFALETLGVSSSIINWPDFEPLEIKMKKTLGLKIYERPVMLIAIGYADPEGQIPYSQKKELNTIRSYNKHGGKK